MTKGFSLIRFGKLKTALLLTLPSRAASAAWLLPSALISCWPVRESILEISVRAYNKTNFWLLHTKQNSQSEKHCLRADSTIKRFQAHSNVARICTKRLHCAKTISGQNSYHFINHIAVDHHSPTHHCARHRSTRYFN